MIFKTHSDRFLNATVSLYNLNNYFLSNSGLVGGVSTEIVSDFSQILAFDSD